MNHQRVTLIAGASKGIGFATAEFLANKGHKVIGIARRLPSSSRMKQRLLPDKLYL